MSADKTLAHELCEQINVWDMFGAIDDEDDLVINVILPAFQERLSRLAAMQEAKAVRLLEESRSDDGEWDRAYTAGRRHAALEAGQVLRAFAYELTAEAKA